MPTRHSVLAKYLLRYGEPESQQIPNTDRQFKFALILPCYAEAACLTDKIEGIFKHQENTLMIIVINNPPLIDALSNSPSINHALAAQLESLGQIGAVAPASKWIHCPQGNSILCIDRYQNGREIPTKQGVGLARKIAADMACQLIENGTLQSQWIYSTDADAELPANYFQASQDALEPQPIKQQAFNSQSTKSKPQKSQSHKSRPRKPSEISAALVPFSHPTGNTLATFNTENDSASNATDTAMRLYEFSMHYYVAALQWCQSPYAFYSIGSTLIINSHHYALARGFPKKSAGEDFYLLNKLAKLGVIVSLSEPVIQLEARTSSRTPFGTGRALQTISSLPSPEIDYVFYSPHCFYYLRQWLAVIPLLWQFRDQPTRGAIQAGLDASHYDPKHLSPGILIDALAQQNIQAALSHGFKQCASQEHFVRHMHDYFDGFRSLKLIHRLRDQHFASINQSALITALNNETFLPIATLLDRPRLNSNSSLIPKAAGLSTITL